MSFVWQKAKPNNREPRLQSHLPGDDDDIDDDPDDDQDEIYDGHDDEHDDIDAN